MSEKDSPQDTAGDDTLTSSTIRLVVDENGKPVWAAYDHSGPLDDETARLIAVLNEDPSDEEPHEGTAGRRLIVADHDDD